MVLVINGDPVAQGRPKFTVRGGRVWAYDPQKSREYKEYVKMIAMQWWGRKPPMEGALSMSVKVFVPIPSSFSKKDRQDAISGMKRPVGKPDLENFCKGATDALEGVVFKNDSQIVAHHEPFGKWYGDRPRIEIEFKEI